MVRWLRILSVGLLVLAHTGLCRAEPSTLLILPFEDLSAPPADFAKAFADLLTSFLASAETVQVVEREDLERVMEEKSLDYEHLTSPATMKQTGTLLQAKQILRGRIRQEKSRISILAFLYQTETGRQVQSFEVQGKADQYLSLAQNLAEKIARHFATRLKPLPELKAENIDENPERNLHFIYALGFYQHQQYAKALPQLMKILAKNPSDKDARYWLGKTYWDANLHEHARLEWQRFLKDFPQDSRGPEVKALLGKTRQ